MLREQLTNTDESHIQRVYTDNEIYNPEQLAHIEK